MPTPAQHHPSSSYVPLIDDRTAVGANHESLLKDLPDLGKPRAKRQLDISDILAVFGSILCLALTYVTVSPSSSIPWRLGVTRQFQIVGFLLSLMNQCFLTIAPKFFLLVEARFGHSYLQNYDAILRSSSTLPSTGFIWRGILMTVVLLPIGLGLAYKEFDHGISQVHVSNGTGSFYGLSAPAGLQESGGGVGLSFMANATASFYSATYNDPIIPSFPQAYGFNTLVLSNGSSAKLDGPFPSYVESIQQNLGAGEVYVLTAPILGTVTRYNDSIESHRDDNDFWNYYLNQMSGDALNYSPDAQNTYIESHIDRQDMYNQQFISILMNNLGIRNTSWAFAAFVPANTVESKFSQFAETFKQNAMLFQTRRERCNGTWRITYNSVQLLNGSCYPPPLSDRSQILFTEATLAIPQWYIPSLVEYLSPFATTRNQSHWLIPTFSTVLNGMWWSRVLSENGYYTWGPNKTIFADPNPNDVLRSDLYYLVDDHVLSIRPTMNASPWLFIALALQPALTIILLFACLLMYTTPLDSGFGMVTLLAGARTETLKLLHSASFSGELKQRLRVKIAVEHRVTEDGLSRLRNEYILGDDSPNGRLPYTLRQHKPWSFLLRLATPLQHQKSFTLQPIMRAAENDRQYRRLDN
ncbi:MAG: hypothetical protein ASARMPREDX12_008555 [Alectoria sarmentosa]|nr:MAG: hypothetical protein ASARMPRED_008470 [Alectoria sarmentosa]CAD6594273.1 MAG: hypothetical protein ASARMPREDX12_008555 [Alectoria sarmentosa]